MSDSEMDNVIL